MEDGRRRVGDLAVQGNVDPAVLFAAPEAVEQAVQDVCQRRWPTGHILTILGHGVLVGTPEENVKVFFDAAKKSSIDQMMRCCRVVYGVRRKGSLYS